MVLAASQPYGARLHLPTQLKIRALHVVPQAGTLSWGDMWAQFNWTGWLKPQVDLAVANGANCVKIVGSGLASDLSPPTAVFNARVRQFINYCWGQGLYVYWGFVSNYAGTVLAATPDLQNVARLLSEFPNVIGLDVGNEAGQFGFVPLATALAFIPIAQAAGSIPITVSQAANDAAELTTAAVQSICEADVDYMDFHPYYTSGEPVSADWATFRGETWYKPWLVGECGQAVSAGAPAVTARWTALGALSSAAVDCFGAVGFCVVDYSADPTEEFGMYQVDLTTVRTSMSVPFASWPGRR